MTERTIEKVLELTASPERVWQAITDADELAHWFGDEAEMDLRPGGDAFMFWNSHGRFAMRVEEVEAPRRLVWSWIHEPDVAFEDAPSTRVEWMLTPREDGGTTLRLRESGFLTDNHHQENTEGWDKELAELVELVEG
jgi:uncharacterized protein YndB with AHSA1/START domain